MRKILALIAICGFVLSCSDSETEQPYNPGKPVAARPVIMSPSGKLAFRLEGHKTELDDPGGHIFGNGFSVNLASVASIRLQIASSGGSETFTIDTRDRPGASPVQESLTISVVDDQTGKVLFNEQNASKSGDDRFVFRNIDVVIPTSETGRIFIRVINETDGGIWSGYVQPYWTVAINPVLEDNR